jgi:serine/threonine protein kinase
MTTPIFPTNDNKIINESKKEVYKKSVSINKWQSRSADIYTKILQVGAGTFGKVYKAKYNPDNIPSLNKNSNELFALKKILMDNEKEGFPITALREIMILKKLEHQNIMPLKEIVTSKPTEKNKYRGSVYLVFEYMQHDLSGLFSNKVKFNLPEIKNILHQILEGLQYLHNNNIIHRDIKSANILLNNKGCIKIGDFGLARFITPSNQKKKYTNRVVTLWYRAPELILGSKNYGPEIDIWSVGCVFSELLKGIPPFKGKDEINQMEKICEKLGTPTDNNWKEAKNLPGYLQYCPKTIYPNVFNNDYKDCEYANRTCLNLLSRMLKLNPKERITVKDALNHEFFNESPKMCLNREIKIIEKESHEFQVRYGGAHKKIINEMKVGNRKFSDEKQDNNNLNKNNNYLIGNNINNNINNNNHHNLIGNQFNNINNINNNNNNEIKNKEFLQKKREFK